MSNEVDVKELFEDLHKVAPTWFMFGVHLKIDYEELQDIKGGCGIVDECFTDVLVRWLNAESGVTIDQLVLALKYPGVDQGRLANEIDKNRAGVQLNLGYLSKKLDCCKANWYMLGIGLGIPDADLKHIEREKRSNLSGKDCLHTSLTYWVKSGKANLDTLVKALNNVKHGALAREIKNKYAGKVFIVSHSEDTEVEDMQPEPCHDVPVAKPPDTSVPSVSAGVLKKKLVNKHHVEITSYLDDLEDKQVKKLGGILGLHFATLQKMKELPDEFVAAWLRREDDVLTVSGEPTYEILAIALEEIGQKGLALDVRQQKHAKSKVFPVSRMDSTEEQKHMTHPLPQNKSQKPPLSSAVQCTEANTSQPSSSDRNQDQTITLTSMKKKYAHSEVKASENVDSDTSDTFSEDVLTNERIQDDFFRNWQFGGKKKGHINAIDRGRHIARLKLEDDDTKTEIVPKSPSQPLTSELGFYPMTADRHGVAIIVNNKVFEGDYDVRLGTDRDEYNLTETWRFLGYHIIILQNCTTAKMIDTFQKIDELLLKVKDVTHDSFVCCILSHGLQGEMVCSDSETLEYRDIIKYISNSVTLKGKPKMLFIQACQVRRPQEERVKDDGKASIYTDYYISWATVDGDKAFRDIYTGSWYITELCKTLCEFGKVMFLDEIQKKVNDEVVEKYKIQQPQGIDRLRRKVLFFLQ